MKYAKLSMILGIIGIITDILMLSYEGAPYGVGFGIIGIGCAIAAKETDDDKTFPKGAKTGLIISIIALTLGIVLFGIQMLGMRVLADPAMSKEVITQMEEMSKSLPDGLRQQFEEALQQFK